MSERALQVMLAVGVLLMAGAVVGGVALAPSSSSPSRSAPATVARPSSTTVVAVPLDATDTVATGAESRPAAPTGTDGAAIDEAAPVTDALDAADPAPEATATASSDGTVAGDAIDCTSVVALADAVALSEGIDFSLAWPQLQEALIEAGDSAAASYRAVTGVAPADIDGDLRLLAEYNTALGATAAAATSVTEFQATVAGPDEALLAATRAVDRFMRDSCSIGLTAA